MQKSIKRKRKTYSWRNFVMKKVYFVTGLAVLAVSAAMFTGCGSKTSAGAPATKAPAAAASAAQSKPAKSTASNTASNTAAKISVDDAKKAALTNAGVQESDVVYKKANLETEDGVLVFVRPIQLVGVIYGTACLFVGGNQDEVKTSPFGVGVILKRDLRILESDSVFWYRHSASTVFGIAEVKQQIYDVSFASIVKVSAVSAQCSLFAYGEGYASRHLPRISPCADYIVFFPVVVYPFQTLVCIDQFSPFGGYHGSQGRVLVKKEHYTLDIHKPRLYGDIAAGIHAIGVCVVAITA